jgi:hypothetical protein
MHAEIRAGHAFHILGPAEPRRVDDPLDATVPGADNIELDTADIAVIASCYRATKGIGAPHKTSV